WQVLRVRLPDVLQLRVPLWRPRDGSGFAVGADCRVPGLLVAAGRKCLLQLPRGDVPDKEVADSIGDDKPLSVGCERTMRPPIALGVALADQLAALLQRFRIEEPHFQGGTFLAA